MIESNLVYHNSKKQVLIHNIAIPQFYKFIKNTTPNHPIDVKLSHWLHATRQFCKKNPNIIFTKADKGNITVAMDKNFYLKKMEDILRDVNIYTVVKRNPAKTIEDNLNNKLKKWLQKEFISKQQFFKLRSSDANLPKAYGLPKVHKDNIPFRLIVSSVNTALYSLASFLQEIITGSLDNTNGYTTNSFDLFNSLSDKQVRESDVLIFLDVISLFINVPLDLAIDSISKRWTHIQKNTKIPKDEF